MPKGFTAQEGNLHAPVHGLRAQDERRGDRIPRADHPRHFQAAEGITRRGYRMAEERTWSIGCSMRMSTPTGRIQRQRCGSTTTPLPDRQTVAASATDIGQATSWPKEVVQSKKDATKAGVKRLTIAQGSGHLGWSMTTKISRLHTGGRQ